MKNLITFISILTQARTKLYRLTAIFLTLLMLFSTTEIAILGWNVQRISAQEQAAIESVQETGDKPAEQPKDTQDRTTSNKLPKALANSKHSDFAKNPGLQDAKLATPQVASGQNGPDPGSLPAGEVNLKPTNLKQEEDVSARTSHTKTIKNTDGTITEQEFFDAINYNDNGTWKAINTKLIEDTNASDSKNIFGKAWGKTRSVFEKTKTHRVKANDWQARFAPSTDKVGMLRVQFKGGSVAFKPVGARKVTPQVSTNADGIETIRYNELWKGVDVQYDVDGDSLKEYIFIKDKSAQNNFEFEIVGANLEADQENPGGFKIKNQLDGQFSITPIFLIRQDAGPIIDSSLYEQKYENGKLKVSVNRDYVQGLPAAAFPLIIDPSTYRTGTPSSGKYKSYKSDGASCSNCMYTGSLYHDGYWRDWRTNFNLGHSKMAGKDIISAKLHVKNTTTSAPYGSSGAWAHRPYRASCTNSGTCVDKNLYGEKKDIGSGAQTFSITSLIKSRLADGKTDTWFIMVGDERNDHTFKNLIPSQTWIDFTYSSRPSVPAPEVPSSNATTEAIVTTTEPQIGVKNVSDSDGDDVDYAYYVASERGITIYQTSWVSNNRLTIPDGILEDTGKYTWYFRIKDPYWASGWTKGGSFRIDLRAGKDKTSTYDEVGPVSVNLNNGNAYTTTDTHSVEALGGSLGVNLHYNSPLASKHGLTAEYYNNTSLTGSPVLRRTEATINNNWSRGSPSQGVVTNDNFGAVYSGYFVAPKDGTYYFNSSNDDEISIYVNDVRIYNYGICPNNCASSAPVTLRAGEIADFRVHYIEKSSVAYANVFVKEASLAPTPQIIPTEWLRTKPKPTDNNTGLMGHYYYDDDASHTDANDNKRFMVRQDPNVNYLWATESPSPGGPVDKFYVRWTGYFTAPYTGTYQFGASADDAAKVTVNNSLTYSAWTAGTLKTGYGGNYNLEAGQRVPIMAEYFESNGAATMQLMAKGPHSPSGEIILPEYLSPGDDFLPDGWEVSGDSSGSILFERLEVKQSGDIDVIDADGSKERFKYQNGAYKPPTNVEAVLIKNSDDSYTITDASGTVYIFNVDGTLRETSSPVDQRKPAALRYSYEAVANSRVRLKEIIDPVDTARKGTLHYAGDTACDESGFEATPAGMLCAFTTYDGRKTVFKYTGGRLARVVEPGNLAVDYSYDVNGMLKTIRSSVSNDAIAAGIRENNQEVLSEISYDKLGRVVSVTPPAGKPGAQRNAHTIEYLPSESKRHVQNVSEPNGYLQYVSFDGLLRTTKACDERAKCTVNEWHPDKDLLLSSTDALGMKTTTIYSDDDLPLHSYGPAPSGWFGADRKPLAEFTDRVPHSETRYDEGISAPAVAYYDVKKFDTNKLVLFGGPKLLKTGNHNNEGKPGQMQGDYNSSAPYQKSDTADGLGASITGRIRLPGTGTYTFTVNHDDSAKVWINDNLVIDNWNRVSDDRVNKVGTFEAVAGQSYKIRVDYANVGVQQGWYVNVLGPNLSQTADWTSFITPNYGLATTTIGYDNKLGNTKTTSQYQDAALGLLGSTKLDPDGLNLESKAAYEESFLRKISKTLPAGNSTSYMYYGAKDTADNPCTPNVEAFRQGGMSKGRVEPDPDGAGPATSRILETVYNDAGQAVATRIGSDPWTCTEYDARGRAVKTVVPTVGARAGRTIQNNYAYENSPLKTMSSDTEGYIVTETDLVGNEIYYRDTRGNKTTSEYNNLGQLTKRTSKLGVETFTYNEYGEVQTTALDGETLATITYDQYGRTFKTDVAKLPGLKIYSSFYDELGRPRGQLVDLPNQNNDYLHYVTEFLERSVGGNVHTHMISANSMSGTENTFQYDGANRLVGAKIAGNQFSYSFGQSNAACNAFAGNNPRAGKNSNRTAMTKNGEQSWYCYDNADRLIGSSNDKFTTPQYDEHGNVLRMGKAGQQSVFIYDQSGRNTRITEGNERIMYVRDVTDRIKTHSQTTTLPDGTANTRHTLYGFVGSGDSPDFTTDTSGNVIEKYIGLPSGLTLTIKPTKTTAKEKLQITVPNMQGHTMVTLDGEGQIKEGLKLYDPFGNAIAATPAYLQSVRDSYSPAIDDEHRSHLPILIENNMLDAEMANLDVSRETLKLANTLEAANNSVPNTNEHSADYGWAGSLQKQTESSISFRPIQMGARVYVAELGRFLSVDPVEGGTENPYVYPANPVAISDYNGKFAMALIPVFIIAIVVVAAFSVVLTAPRRPVTLPTPSWENVKNNVAAVTNGVSRAWDSVKSRVRTGTKNDNQNRGYRPRSPASIRFATAKTATRPKEGTSPTRAIVGSLALTFLAIQLEKGMKPHDDILKNPGEMTTHPRYTKYEYWSAICRCHIHYNVRETPSGQYRGIYDDMKIQAYSD